MDNPSLESQGSYWGDWAVASDRGEGRGDPYGEQVCDWVRACAARCAERERAADIGCGTGWITLALDSLFPAVWATDLAPAALEQAKRALPRVEFVQGDFLALGERELPRGPCDLVVSCEVVAHVADQREFFARCRKLLRPGGRFLLFTQNPATWSRSSYLTPPSPNQLRRWLSLPEIRAHYESVGFRIESTGSLQPMGDKGRLWWRPYAQGVLRRVIGRPRAQALFERLGYGRTLVVEAFAI